MKRFGRLITSVVSIALVVALLLLGGKLVERSSRSEGTRIAEESIRRAAVQCYALEGFYPPNLEYLTQRYGIQVDEAVYFVHYSYIADNIAPDVTVILQREG